MEITNGEIVINRTIKKRKKERKSRKIARPCEEIAESFSGNERFALSFPSLLRLRRVDHISR